MVSTLSPTRSAFSANLWPDEPLPDGNRRPAHQKNDPQFSGRRLSLGKRASRAFVRFLFTFAIGVAATFAWQSHGDAAREMIATSFPQLGWLAPPERLAQTTPDISAPAALAGPSLDPQQLQAMSLGLAAVRQSVDQLAAQLALGHQQMAGEIAKLQEAEQNILHMISAPPPRPAAAPARKPVPLTPPPSQAPPVR